MQVGMSWFEQPSGASDFCSVDVHKASLAVEPFKCYPWGCCLPAERPPVKMPLETDLSLL